MRTSFKRDLFVGDEAIQVGLVGIAENLIIAMILHHYDEDVIEMGESSSGVRAVIGERGLTRLAAANRAAADFKLTFIFIFSPFVLISETAPRGNFKRRVGTRAELTGQVPSNI